LLNSAIDLVDKAIKMLEVHGRLSNQAASMEPLKQKLAELRVEEARLEVRFNRDVL
jgi:hypothetical protein